MHLFRQKPEMYLVLLLLVFFTQIICIYTRSSLQDIWCDPLQQNCTIKKNSSVSYLRSSTIISQRTSSPSKSRPVSKLTSLTYYPVSTSRPKPSYDFDSFSDNLKRAALILAGIALVLGILRICLILCKSRSPNNSFSIRNSAVVRPHVSTIEQHPFKPDLPPPYTEALNQLENGVEKLPKYEELPDEQRLGQRASGNNEACSTQL